MRFGARLGRLLGRGTRTLPRARSRDAFVIDQERPDLGGNFRHGDVGCFTPKVWDFVTSRFAVGSMLDVGCGEGHAVAYFNRLGVYAHGIDGLELNVQRAIVPIAHHDLSRGPYIMPVDLVTCVEVVEHIEEQYLDNLLTTLSNGSIVLMTHAFPDQPGHHHVNCKPPEYWIEKLAERGYDYSEETKLMRRLADDEGWPNHMQRSGLLFIARD
jgi:SAM-dependent methyltransferase